MGAVAARVAVVIVVVAACVVAWTAGGGGDEKSAAPMADAGAGESGAGTDAATARSTGESESGRLGDAYEVVMRLVEGVKDARVEVADPREAAFAAKVMGAHWRKMRPAWMAAGGANARNVTTIALRTSAIETQWSMPSNTAGKAWTPDAKVWNMNEGSYDQRDALVGATPSSFAYKVTVPNGARLTFSEGTVNATRDTTVFIVTAVDAKGASHEVYRHRLGPAGARRWTDATCDLAAFAGQTIELRLATEMAPSTLAERDAAARQREAVRRAELDAGAPEAGSVGSAVANVDAIDADAGAVAAAKEELLASPGNAIALWGSPVLLARTIPRLPYNVVWIVVDALRPDVIASFHDDADDAAKLAAPTPPLEALLPRVPGLTPAIDALAKRGVRFTRAYSGGSWTRPGTLAMLAGARSSELGLDTQQWVLHEADTARFYASDPPLLPLIARRHGASTQAFVNNYFMVGYAPVGVDMGFEHVADHRYRTRDTLEVTRDATTWIRDHRDTRFFMFVNYNSPHEPYEPPPKLLERIPPPPAGPADRTARLYMAEAAKDDEAIGVVVEALADAGLRERTIIVVTSDHGETMSSAHTGTSALDHMPIRYHHAVSNFEETTHVPILVVAPGLLPEDRMVKERVRSTDLAPTITELLGLEPHPRFSGRSLVALAKGEKEKDERVVVSEGRGTRSIIHGRHRLIVREGLVRTTMYADRSVTSNEELYDLTDDPGERHDLAPAQPELVAEMRARLDAALKNVPVAGSAAALAGLASDEGAKPPAIHLRFAGGGKARRVSGTITFGDARTKARSFTVDPVELARDALTIAGEKASIAFMTSATATTGFDLVVDPPAAPVTWDFYLDDQPWPEDGVFGGPFGLLARSLRYGIAADETRARALSPALPTIDPRRDVGVFITRDRRGSGGEESVGHADADQESAEETARLLREWGYAK
jgi:arylsulfatase A-like enzyme